MTLIDSRIYIHGELAADSLTLDDTFRALRRTGGLAWVGLDSPGTDELDTLASALDLHPLAIEDTQKGHQRAKIDRYGDTLFIVLRPAWYDDSDDSVHFEEVHLFVSPDAVITVRHGQTFDLGRLRDVMEGDPEFLRLGPEAAMTTILDEIVDSYAPVAAGLQHDVDQVEDALFASSDVDPELSKRIYQLLSEAIQFQRAIGPVPDMLQGMLRGAARYGTPEEVQNRLRNVYDHAVRATERADTVRTLLENALTVHSTLVTVKQNDAMRRMSSASLAQGEMSRHLAQKTIDQGEEVKKISSWAAILFTPTLVAGVYGMNFDDMPELHWQLGYPFALVLMLGVGVTLWSLFKWRKWL